MRITFIADKLNLMKGGSNRSLHLMAELMAARGHAVRVVTLNFIHDNDLPADPAYEIIEDPVAGHKVSKARQIVQKIDSHDSETDVLHVFNPAILSLAGYYRSRRGHTPTVGRLNTYDGFCTNLGLMNDECFRRCTVKKKFSHDDTPRLDKLSNVPEYLFDTHGLPFLLDRLDRLFALSPTVKEVYCGIGVDPATIGIVPNFYDPGFLHGGDSTEPFADGRFTVLYVGRIGAEKGVDVLVESISNLHEPSRFHFEIVGDGPARPDLEAFVAENGLSDRVTFHGWVENRSLPAYYRAADAFVHPGRWPEPFGRTVLEALQSQCRPIVSDIGAPPWIAGECGLTFDRNDPTDLARKIEDVEAGRHALHSAAYAERLSTFEPERIASTIEDEYLALLD